MLKALTPEEAAGAVDLEEIGCDGCRYASSKKVCKRFPPIFKPPVPVMVNGQPQLEPGGWAFPPAIRKCGEFESARVLQ